MIEKLSTESGGSDDPIPRKLEGSGTRSNSDPVGFETVLEKIRRALRSPYSKAAVLASSLVFLASAPLDNGEKFDFSGIPNTPSVIVTLPDGGKLDFAQWQDFMIDKIGKYPSTIKPRGDVARFITAKDQFVFGAYNIQPGSVRNEEVFTAWVKKQLQSSDIYATTGKMPEDMDAKDLVEAAAIIVMSNLKYDDVSSREEVDLKVETLKEPVDLLLMGHLKAECEHYSSAMVGVFNVLKKLYPEALNNIYVVPTLATHLAHYYDSVVQVNGPDDAKISFIDPTTEDPDGWHNVEASDRDLSTLLESMKTRGIISEENAMKLAKESHLSKEQIASIN